jgi:hypothetical protein
MSKNSDAEKTRWDQVMENFDLLFQSVNDIGLIQQELKRDLHTAREDQKKIAQQVQANGHAVANMTLKQMEHEAVSDTSDGSSVVFEEEEFDFQNVFAKGKKEFKARTSKPPRQHHDQLRKNLYLTMLFPRFISQNLMGLVPRFGLIIASTTSPSILYLMH